MKRGTMCEPLTLSSRYVFWLHNHLNKQQTEFKEVLISEVEDKIIGCFGKAWVLVMAPVTWVNWVWLCFGLIHWHLTCSMAEVGWAWWRLWLISLHLWPPWCRWGWGPAALCPKYLLQEEGQSNKGPGSCWSRKIVGTILSRPKLAIDLQTQNNDNMRCYYI